MSQLPPSGPPPQDRIVQEPPPGGRRKWLIGGAVAAALVLVAGVAVGATAIFGSSDDDDLGPQPAAALPASSTFAYASIDFDPADGEKAELVSTLLKFPGFVKNVSLSGGDDLRERLFQAIVDSEGNSCNLSWDADFAAWAGTKAAVAGVEVGDKPEPVLVLQVTDADKAAAAFAKFDQCEADEPASSFAFSDGWAVVSESKDVVDQLVSQAAQGTLADDATYQQWTGAAGDPGFLQAYAAPQAGQVIADAIASDQTGSLPEGLSPAPGTDFLRGVCPGIDGVSGKAAQSYADALRGFKGADLTGRVNNGGVELEGALDVQSTDAAPITPTSDGAQLVAGLPSDTGAALGISVPEHYYERLLDGFAKVCGSGFDADKVNRQLSSLTGLTFPDDIDALLGKAIALSVGQVDASTLDALNGGDIDSLPLALTFEGDSGAISGVLDKIIGNLGAGRLVGHDTSGDRVILGTDGAYRQHVAGDGGLGDTDAFKDVVPHADQASSVLFVDFDQFDGAVKDQSPQDYTDYYQGLHALGISGWYDGSTSHFFARMSTD